MWNEANIEIFYTVLFLCSVHLLSNFISNWVLQGVKYKPLSLI